MPCVDETISAAFASAPFVRLPAWPLYAETPRSSSFAAVFANCDSLRVVVPK